METPEGDNMYTRDGQFHVNSEGVLVNSRGSVLQGENGRIQLIPSLGQFTVNKEGGVFQGNTLTGRIRIMNFEDPQKLRRVEGGFMAGGQDPQQIEEPKLLQGFLENSNVNPLREMVNMISLSRIHEANNKMIQNYDQLFGKAISILGQTS
jgi:flagellar basal body rod protein FlgG